MSDINHDPTRQADVLKNLLGLIEDIRYKRQNAWRDRLHPKGYRFTQLELKQVALPTYGNLLAGNSKRLPARQQILDVADYLECTIAETNDLLRTAQYLPERNELSSRAYQKLLDRAIMLTRLIPLPTAVLKPDIRMEYASSAFLRINNLPAFDALPTEYLLGPTWYLDPKLSTYPLYNLTPKMAEINARQIAELLWFSGKPYLHEPWFKATVSEYVKFPTFKRHWDIVRQNGLSLDDDDSGRNIMQTSFVNKPIEEGSILLPLNDQNDLVLYICTPTDEAAREVYRRVDCQIDSVRWEDALKDLAVSST